MNPLLLATHLGVNSLVRLMLSYGADRNQTDQVPVCIYIHTLYTYESAAGNGAFYVMCIYIYMFSVISLNQVWMTQVVLHRYNTIILENIEVKKCDIFHFAFF